MDSLIMGAIVWIVDSSFDSAQTEEVELLQNFSLLQIEIMPESNLK